MSNNYIDDMLKNQISKKPKKRGSGVFVILLIFIIAIIAGGVCVFFYIKNQNKPTSKMAFIQYLGKSNMSTVLNFEKMNTFNNRIQNEPSETEIKITGNDSGFLITDPNIDVTEISTEITSQNIPSSEKFSSEVSLKYEDNNMLNFEILSNKNKIAVFSDEFLTKYIGSKYSELNRILNKFISGKNDTPISVDFEELRNMKLVLPQISDKIFEKYIEIINQKEPDTVFSERKITLDRNSQKLDVTEYSMALNESQMIELVDQLLQTLESDDELLDMLLASFGENSVFIKELVKSRN